VLAKTTNVLTSVWECMQMLEQLSVPNKSHCSVVLGHCGILGNEKVDKLAKEGTNKASVDQTTGIPFAVGKEVIKSHLRQEHLNSLKACNSYHIPRP
jgi:gamma-glutamylcysteine synthetase